MGRNSPPPSAPEPPATTETFQQHYGRGSGYHPDEHAHHHGHPPPPPPPHPHSQHSPYPPSHYAPSGPPPPHPPHGHRGGPHPPPPHGYHHPPSWGYYPPHAPAGGPPAEMAAASSSSRRSSSRQGAKKPNGMPYLVTPKSHDSETLPPVAGGFVGKASGKKPAAKSPSQKASKRAKKDAKSPSSNDKELEEEEPQVDPMKQDFHFYAADKFEEVKRESQQQLDNAVADGSVPETNKENQLFMLTTLLNARLVQNWEMAPPATRTEYLKKEESDRKRFMSEEEVASRHCATLTARRRSPKQSGALGRAGSFGLNATVEVPQLSPDESRAGRKRSNGELDAEEVPAKRNKGETVSV